MSITRGWIRNDIPDEVAVLRAVGGDEIRLTPAEGALAVTELHRRGWNDCQIARHLNVWPRTVGRIRKRLGLPPNVDSGRHPIPTQETP